ncbi:vWA domain-containing protein [Actinoplanes sp. NPDC049548]|uniref:vWA domain-containing protein n=1 Tax=Actinoplanes sp. NPDC049548 TaxID=3155152 RepID=UPI003444F977
MSSRWNSDRHRLVVVPGPGLVNADRLVVSDRDLPGDSAGLLTVGGRRTGVRLFARPELPSGTIAIAAGRAAELLLTDDQTAWTLTADTAAEAARITLEPMTDGAMQDLSRAVLHATDLAGRVVHLDADDSAWIEIASMPFRVRAATARDGSVLEGLVRIGRGTEISLYGKSGRTGVDIVVLADCSGSMNLADVPAIGGEDPYAWQLGTRSGGTITRADTQKRALLRLLDARLSASGRPSRIALVRFGTACEVMFPVSEGMAEVSADSGPEVAQTFRSAVTRLQPQAQNTDIGGALHFASELLHRHGVPGNERLIVLVSDGAEFNPKGDDSTGEAFQVTRDAVSLMDELRQVAGIRLHAIGISDRQAFQRWCDRENGGSYEPWMVPDHRLLTNLVQVGGGDPSRIGGLDVLEDYFGSLGGGVTTRIGVPAEAGRLPSPQPDLATLAQRQLGVDTAERQEFARGADEIFDRYAECLTLAGVRPDLRLLRQQRHVDQFSELKAVAQTRTELKAWIDLVEQIFEPRPTGLAPELAPLATDRRRQSLRQVRDDNQAPLAEDDALGWFRVQSQLAQTVCALLGDIRDALLVAARSGAPSPAQSDEEWYAGYDNFE